LDDQSLDLLLLLDQQVGGRTAGWFDDELAELPAIGGIGGLYR
jgi:hypothetical protein